MSDPNLPRTVVSDPDQAAPPARRVRAGAQRCRFCTRENDGDVVDVGGDIGRVHRACFIDWDREQEALEMALMEPLSMPDPGEDWTEREIAGDDPLTRAA